MLTPAGSLNFHTASTVPASLPATRTNSASLVLVGTSTAGAVSQPSAAECRAASGIIAQASVVRPAPSITWSRSLRTSPATSASGGLSSAPQPPPAV